MRRLLGSAFFLVSLLPYSAWAQDLASLTDRINSINETLVVVGGALSVGGFAWAMMGVMVGMAGAARAITVMVSGLLISVAPQVIGFLTGS